MLKWHDFSIKSKQFHRRTARVHTPSGILFCEKCQNIIVDVAAMRTNWIKWNFVILFILILADCCECANDVEWIIEKWNNKPLFSWVWQFIFFAYTYLISSFLPTSVFQFDSNLNLHTHNKIHFNSGSRFSIFFSGVRNSLSFWCVQILWWIRFQLFQHNDQKTCHVFATQLIKVHDSI